MTVAMRPLVGAGASEGSSSHVQTISIAWRTAAGSTAAIDAFTTIVRLAAIALIRPTAPSVCSTVAVRFSRNDMPTPIGELPDS